MRFGYGYQLNKREKGVVRRHLQRMTGYSRAQVTRLVEFHCDNGSEYVNERVAEILNRTLIKLTKSRPRKTNDNALVEGKNGSIIRKWLGYGYIEQKFAPVINEFYGGEFHEYVNYHRPCAFATEIVDKKGKVKKIYKPKDYLTPYEKLRSLPKANGYLKEGVTFEMLDEIAVRRNDNEMAELVQREREKLFEEVIYQPIALTRSGSLFD